MRREKSDKRDTDYVLLNVKKENMEIKKYDLRLLAQASFDSEETYRFDDGAVGKKISKINFRKILSDKFKISRKQSKLIIDVFLNCGVMREKDKNFYIMKVDTNFIKLYSRVLSILHNGVSRETFKVYCYLLNKWNMHNKYHYKENYRFSIKELCNVCGYNCRSAESNEKFKDIVSLLISMKCIECDFTKNKKYIELINVDPNPDPVKIREALDRGQNSFNKVQTAFAEASKPLIYYSDKQITFNELTDELESCSVPSERYRQRLYGILSNRNNKDIYEYYKNDAEEWLAERNL